MRNIVAGIVCLLVALAGAVWTADHAEAKNTKGYPDRPIALCQGGEVGRQIYCVWDAKRMGNHQGTSFKIRRDGTFVQLKSQTRVYRILTRHGYDLIHGRWVHMSGPVDPWLPPHGIR